ncbi:MAG TPA: ABC transporter permease [Candidatus Eisenbacteria bacterium]|nr:ABC transporter permease [Candidatus Eisenbacteria bacterium]
MNFLRRLAARLSNLLARQTDQQRLVEEMEEHVPRQTEDNLRSGMTPTEARRQALIKFGAVEAIREQYHAEKSLPLIESIVSDIRYSLRILRKNWGFTAIAATSLALAIGANTTIFSITKRVLLDRLHVPHPEQLRLLHWHGDKHTAFTKLWGISDDESEGFGAPTFPYPVFEQLRQDNRVFQDLFAFKDVGRMNATINGNAQIVQGELVSGNFFDQMQVQPQLGRPIVASDDVVTAPPVALISPGLWHRAFASSPLVLGRSIKVNMVPVTIIGVAPPGFTGAKSVQSAPDLFLPLSSQPLVAPRGKNGSLLGSSSPQMCWLNIMGRTKAGISEATAQAALDVSLAAVVRSSLHPDGNTTVPHINLLDGSRGLFLSKGMFAKPVGLLTAIAALVLLLACSNIASMLLARSAARHREIAVRLALGAGRIRVLRGVLTESLLLSGLGGALGIGVAFIGCHTFPALVANSWEVDQFQIALEPTVLAFTAGITILSGVLFGMVPAWIATRNQVSASLKSAVPTSSRRRSGLTGKTIVAFQVMLSTLLVAGALLFVRTLFSLAHVDPGFRTDGLVLFAIQQPESRYPSPKDLELHHRIEERLRAVPGVKEVTVSEVAYISGSSENAPFLPEGEKIDPEKEQAAWNNSVGARFFQTMGIPIIAGRDFNEHDTATSPKVGILNESLARKAFPGQNPIGKHFLANFEPNEGKPGDFIEVVGVCGDTRYWSLKQQSLPMFYQPYLQVSNLDFGATYELRTSLRPESIAPSLRAAVQSIDPDLPLQEIRTQQEQIDASMQTERIIAALTASFGVLALILACVGVYGVMAYSVAQRTSEIGIRMALGSLPRQVLTMVLSEAGWISFAGIACGLCATVLLTRLVKSLLYATQPNDPFVLSGSALILGAVGLAASWIPATRAASVEPMQALRHE